MESYDYFKYIKSQKNTIKVNDSDYDALGSIYHHDERLYKKIRFICKNQKRFIEKKILMLLEHSKDNTSILCDYIISEQNEINIKESTKEGKIKILVDFITFLDHKSYRDVDKEDVLLYLNKFRKSEDDDPSHRWIGTWNNKHMVLLKFFRWLYDPDNADIKNRKTPDCMNGVKRLTRKEVSRYKPSDLWTPDEYEVFLKYCPSKRDRAFFSMALDTSCRPHELLNLRIEEIQFKISSDKRRQYAETTINGKTGQRTVPLIRSIPYIKEWLLEHPFGSNKNYWVFVSQGRSSFGKKLTRDGLLKHFQEYYRDKYYPTLLLNEKVPERDKAFIRSFLSKPVNLYITRHISLTEKSIILSEHMLRNHAGWSNTSKMPQVYIHHLGGASSKHLLQAYGMEKSDGLDLMKKISNSIINCPSCNEPNRVDNNFCFHCANVLSFDRYSLLRSEDEQKISHLESELNDLKDGMNRMLLLVQQNPLLANIKPEALRTK